MYLSQWKLDDLKAELANSIIADKTALEKWQEVTRNTKKDGSDFVNLKKNFNNARIDDRYNTVWIEVDYCMQPGGYKSDSIYITDLSVNEIFKAITEHIRRLDQRIKDNEYNLIHFKDLTSGFIDNVEKAFNSLSDVAHGDNFVQELSALICKEYKYYIYHHIHH